MANKWVFTTQLAGSYSISLPDGEQEEHIGLDMFLGVGEGDNPDKAFGKIFYKLGLDRLHLNDAVIYAHKIVDDHKVSNVNLSKAIRSCETDSSTSSIIVNNKSNYSIKSKACEWCGKDMPTNGAAQFSHIKMHVRQLVDKGKLTKEQAAGVRSVKLSGEIRKIFEEHFKKGKQ